MLPGVYTFTTTGSSGLRRVFKSSMLLVLLILGSVARGLPPPEKNLGGGNGEVSNWLVPHQQHLQLCTDDESGTHVSECSYGTSFSSDTFGARPVCEDIVAINRYPLAAVDVDQAQKIISISQHDDVKETPSPPLQIQPLVVSGPSRNRVDLVFFSDGYITEEYNKFLDDAMRLAQDISGNQTYNTVKPLLNFWAAFSPSNESGIGTGGQPKDTPFGLYRDGTELRGVYYSKPEAAGAACSSMGDQCDYPILLGNDPLYGGLGGPFTVITSSLANGPLVLRHELGHSIIGAADEYDGADGYSGLNAVTNLSDSLPWAHWLTHPSDDAPPRVERSVMPMQQYPWTLLNTSVPWATNFTSSGAFSRHVVRFSLSGLPEETDLKVELDGLDLGWTPQPGIGLDRWHYDVHRDEALHGGVHDVQFTLINQEREGVAQLCSVEILEFGDETEFINTPGYHGIFPTYSEINETSYRPTNEDCLMRIVTSTNFCKVCAEGLWLSLLRRVEFIDDVVEGCRWDPAPGDNDVAGRWRRTLEARLVPLAQFRQNSANVTEGYTVTWFKDGNVLEPFANKTRIEVDDDIALGVYSIDVKYDTEEVRVDTDGLLTSGGEYIVRNKCNL